jgi:endonuclease/exonuclease/phosphatase (EEP) superfamily protein YafD
MLQAHAVVDALAGIEGPLLLLGDFNAVPDSEPLRLIEHAGFLRANAGASSTSGNLDVDHIFGHRLVVQSARLPDTGPVSDHQPVIAEVRVR